MSTLIRDIPSPCAIFFAPLEEHVCVRTRTTSEPDALGFRLATSLTALLREEVTKICPLVNPKTGQPYSKTWSELLVMATMSLAIQGSATALREAGTIHRFRP